jgi:hypothetical protein
MADLSVGPSTPLYELQILGFELSDRMLYSVLETKRSSPDCIIQPFALKGREKLRKLQGSYVLSEI